MVDIKVDYILLEDFYSLTLELRQFMSLNMVHLDSNSKTEEGKKKLKELITYSLQNVNYLNIFKEPIKNNAKYNIEILSKNLNNLMQFIHKYISYAGSILKDYYPKMYDDRFKRILGLYVDFRDKHNIN